jgi:ParB family transcriptional regulator, chromosome partitioning protein
MAFQGDSIYWVEVEKIVPNPFQPRREFDEQKLRELADSVRMYGILQPLTVTRNEIQREDGTFYTEYELIAGERRLRASKLAGLSQVPVIIREGEDSEQEKLELAIIENLQREDLNSVDRALAFRQLADVFGLSHSQVAKKVGRSREYVSNSIRLLGLPDYMLKSLRLGEISEGHARTLLMLNDRPEEQDVVFREILLKKISVREVERIVRKIATEKVRKTNPYDIGADLIEMEKKFMETLGTRVQIQKTDYGGRLTIDYFTVEDLESMLTRMETETPNTAAAQNAQLAALVANTPLEYSAVSEELNTVTEVPLPEEGLHEEAEKYDTMMSATDEALLAPDNISQVSPYMEEVGTENLPEENNVDYYAIEQQVQIQSQPEIEISEEIAEAIEPAILSESVGESITLPEEIDERVVENNPLVAEILASETEMSPVHEVEEPAPAIVNKDDDDSDLYTIRHFSI